MRYLEAGKGLVWSLFPVKAGEGFEEPELGDSPIELEPLGSLRLAKVPPVLSFQASGGKLL